MAGWEELLGGLADALGGSGGRGGAGRPVREPHVERLPPQDEFAQAQAETRRMMQEATREMARDFQDSVEPLRQRMERAEAKVIDIDSNVISRLDEMESALREINLQALEAERLENKLNALIVLVIALVVITLWLGLR
ncbi:MAG: hypothetical protein KDC27_13270 [Acidobacteria bacterium]|nr:hypothetical protein [Acidobacteriota bacterium]